ncbi:MAG TPA: DUF1801 domain-containing protein, partial [Gemmatales bacterium]|nr:DUF1801 domain-containing protein [Gemmatales bacterium]
MHPDIVRYNQQQTSSDQAICNFLATVIDEALPEAECKIWHAHPVWFLEDNPVAGYSKLKSCVRLLFWSGQSFEEPALLPEGRFQAAEARYHTLSEVDEKALR